MDAGRRHTTPRSEAGDAISYSQQRTYQKLCLQHFPSLIPKSSEAMGMGIGVVTCSEFWSPLGNLEFGKSEVVRPFAFWSR